VTVEAESRARSGEEAFVLRIWSQLLDSRHGGKGGL
jgi:hypothetical protein